MKLKPKTILIYRAIEQSWRDKGNAPTLREIGAQCAMAHTSCMRHLDKLEAGGYIERWPGKFRSIRILKPIRESIR